MLAHEGPGKIHLLVSRDPTVKSMPKLAHDEALGISDAILQEFCLLSTLEIAHFRGVQLQVHVCP